MQVLSFRSGVIVFQVFSFLFFPGPGGDDIPWTMLGLQIRLTDILAQDADADQLDSAQQADDTDRGGPADNRLAHDSPHHGPDHQDQAYDAESDSEGSNQADGFHG